MLTSVLIFFVLLLVSIVWFSSFCLFIDYVVSRMRNKFSEDGIIIILQFAVENRDR